MRITTVNPYSQEKLGEYEEYDDNRLNGILSGLKEGGMTAGIRQGLKSMPPVSLNSPWSRYLLR